MTHFLLLIIVSLLTCIGQVCQKQAVIYWQSGLPTKNSLAIKWLLTAIILLVLGMLFWLKLLQILPLSIAYPMLSINFVIVTLIGQFIYQEKISIKHWIGVFIIMLGIVLLNI
ncbi:putative 4-amino-4-deoxy-L-arabinose-phosphoundecaprenol flippase subunit ArnE [Arsenophonus endosymbiont of Aleurodicus floccissimus]|uniref:4-amino-4-deoxy-L-arabinose-phosphoundecaprenol flippase subunit ArnE n=1 Tax=Arsenophonus endosymbiont of Aleurodicus floccissimus TaxID=2152761 RepID=UPI000E6B2BE2|nr:4-amino-4-deoxy-L-arabinose-phosphoundecaprenol flippase subunit ArnE [Arsenophonus endosymbiont of Aleurodicus floccissimus]SPP31118.1 putative 4-amino-4-deoxy-L-arabinose-phosphoundecaprenol flippase subunit ArnE [Arsenophonus endosymbiont of Aleurodicus floccissimus]